MRIAILGATSQIAKDLMISFSESTEDVQLYLFARRLEALKQWLVSCGLLDRYPVLEIADLNKCDVDVVINFIGIGNDPSSALAAGNTIFDITLRFDEMVLDYLRSHRKCRYFFLSSGAAYGSSFNEPARLDTCAVVPINNLAAHEWYGLAKLYAECRHRSYPDLFIIDLRVFNYFSRNQDISARFLITDILRAIRDEEVLTTSPDFMMRDFLHPSDFYRLVAALIAAPAANAVVDCYSLAPVDKPTLLSAMQNKFGLQYEVAMESNASVNATGKKPYYYSLNRRAADFGYHPKFTSLDGVMLEASKILQG